MEYGVTRNSSVIILLKTVSSASGFDKMIAKKCTVANLCAWFLTSISCKAFTQSFRNRGFLTLPFATVYKLLTNNCCKALNQSISFQVCIAGSLSPFCLSCDTLAVYQQNRHHVMSRMMARESDKAWLSYGL